MKWRLKFYIFALILLFVSMAKLPLYKDQKIEKGKPEEKTQEVAEEPKNIVLTFAGDLMAHDTNYLMKDYNKIYEDLAGILLTDDLSFCNFEMPICDSLPMSSYPSFNVHSSYLMAAVNGGFEVFALANNHTNDKGINGIDGTLKSIENVKTATTEKEIYFSGLKKAVGEKLQPTIIEKNGFKIIFLSVTELLNRYDTSKTRLYYSEPSVAGREALLTRVKEIRAENPCDIFVLSLHLYEAEYGTKVTNEKKAWFQKLGLAGVDIICASHPHVMQTWEKVPSKRLDTLGYKLADESFNLHSHFFMYSMGNFISGQRIKLNTENPKHYREYTGDAVLLQLEFTKRGEKVLDDFSVKTIPITVYNSTYGLVMKRFTDEFIKTLTTDVKKKYYQKRLSLMKEYLPIW